MVSSGLPLLTEVDKETGGFTNSVVKDTSLADTGLADTGLVETGGIAITFESFPFLAIATVVPAFSLSRFL